MKYDFPDELNLRKFKIKSLLPDSTILCLGRRRCLLKGTEVLMFDGSVKRIEDINIGDYVMGDDSTKRKVLSLHNGTDVMYNISHKIDGSNYIVNSAHILVLKDITNNNIIEISVDDYLKLPFYKQEILHGVKNIVEYQERNIDYSVYKYGSDISKMLNDCIIRGDIISKIKDISIDSVYRRKMFIYGLLSSIKNSSNIYVKCKKLRDILKRMLDSICIKNSVIKNNILLNVFNRINTSPICIKEYGKGEFYGLTIDGNNRYTLANYIVTHNSGKSWLVRDILYNYRHIPAGVVFSGTEHASPFFSDFVPDSFIHTKYNPELIDQIMIKQRQKIRKAKAQNKGNNGKMPENNFFIILDDMLHEAQTWKRDETIKNIFFNGRHYNFMFFLTMQYPLGITPDLRSNIDYVFIFNEPSLKNRKKIYDDYASMIPDFTYFCNILDECTKNHQCLVIKTSGNGINEQVFWYKAEYRQDFKVGHPKIWEYHQKNYNPEYEAIADRNAERIHNITKKFNKTKKLKVIVSKTTGDIEECHETDSD